MAPGRPPLEDSLSEAYAERLNSRARWKRFVDVQAPYRWNLKRLEPGLTLDIGCGVGRNLRNLGGNAVGVDPNRWAVAEARNSGFEAYEPEEFRRSAAAARMFDSLLLAHVLEHLSEAEGANLVIEYLRWVKPAGQVILITPQEAGFRSDPSHRHFLDNMALETLCRSLGLTVTRSYSFPFPRSAGRIFTYNEFVVTARVDVAG